MIPQASVAAPRIGSEGPHRVAMVSLHTSPLEQPGTGDAGGMNVYVLELSRRLARRGVEVDVFTRSTSPGQDPVVAAADGVLVHHVAAGPLEGVTKAELAGRLKEFSRGVLQAATLRGSGPYDVVHSHYWLSGKAGLLARERWGVPLAHSMHTMAKVKNARLAGDDVPEPPVRVLGEQRLVRAADLLVANTAREARELVEHYGAEPARVEVVHPGVDLAAFRPVEQAAARRAVGVPEDAHLVVFVGRLQPLKAPDVLVRAAADLLARDPDLRQRLVVAVVGGPSGEGRERLESLVRLSESLGVRDVVRFVPPATRAQLVHWYAAASAVCVPSYSESFGLVALEAQACGAPVVAAAVGGLPTAVADGRSGLLVHGHDPVDYARAFERLLHRPGYRERLSRGAIEHASGFSWDDTAERTLAAYRRAARRRADPGPDPARQLEGVAT